ncbi:MAG: pseudouridine synthase [Candidatus Dormibacteria bacterium]
MPAERLGRWLARNGVASRREADRLMAEGRVSVDGEVAPPSGRLIDPDRNQVRLDGRLLETARAPRRYLLLNKPWGVVSTARDPAGRTTVLDLVPDRRGLFPVGRLDADSRGLMLLTDDGDLALRLTHPRYQVAKTYLVGLREPLDRDQLERLRQGPELADGPTHPLEVRARPGRRPALLLTLAEGRRRQVRRMCQAVGAAVTDLQRVELAGLRLGTLAEGRLRELSLGEVRRLRSGAGLE